MEGSFVSAEDSFVEHFAGLVNGRQCCSQKVARVLALTNLVSNVFRI